MLRASVPEPPLSWVERPSLTGDWGGLRLASTSAEWRRTRPTASRDSARCAGSLNGADWTSELEFGIDVDLEKLVGWEGGVCSCELPLDRGHQSERANRQSERHQQPGARLRRPASTSSGTSKPWGR